MRRISLLSTFVLLTLASCGDNGGISAGSGGATTMPPPGAGGMPGSGGTLPPWDTVVGGAIGLGGVIGTGAGIDAPAGTGGGSGGISLTGAGGAVVPGGSGGIPLISDGGVVVTGGSGGIPLIGDGGVVATGGTGVVGSGGIPGSGGTVATGGTGVVGCDQDLSGTWDLFATSVGTGIVSATLVVSKEGFSLTARRAQLNYKAGSAPSATWAYQNPWYGSMSTRVIAVESTPAPANTGSFPIAIGGHWVLQSNTETCVLDVAADKVTGKCTGLPEAHNVGAGDWPDEVLPSPENGLTYTIRRSNPLASQFGDFGGNWTAMSDSGSGQGCNLKLEGNGASTSCRASNSFNGALHLTVGANCVASGVTPSGLEVSARRR
jgi:hypothetical protein